MAIQMRVTRKKIVSRFSVLKLLKMRLSRVLGLMQVRAVRMPVGLPRVDVLLGELRTGALVADAVVDVEAEEVAEAPETELQMGLLPLAAVGIHSEFSFSGKGPFAHRG